MSETTALKRIFDSEINLALICPNDNYIWTHWTVTIKQYESHLNKIVKFIELHFGSN